MTPTPADPSAPSPSGNRAQPRKGAGICYLAGAGPGDPGLITVRAMELIRSCDVIVYDYLVNAELLRHCRADAELIYAGKKAGQHTLRQPEINALLVEKTTAGHRVLRLKGGDPILFGRGAEEAEALEAAGLAYEFVPGISSALAGPLYAGIPVTHREHNAVLTIFTGHEDPDKEASGLDYRSLATAAGTKVMLMGVQRLAPITARLIEGGADPTTPVALVRWATTGRQQTLTGTLDDIADKAAAAGFQAPAVAVIGSGVGCRQRLNWFESRPLFGRRIVVTRTRQQAGVLSAQLAALGADVQELPTIRIDPAPDPVAFARLVADAHTYDWLVFTSPNGVDIFFKAFFQAYDDARSIGGARIAVVGPGTGSKVKEYRLAVDLMPKERFVAEGLVEAFGELDIENQTVLWVRPDKTRDLIAAALAGRGAIVDELVAYRTVAETGDVGGGQARLREEGADVITFTSASTAENFAALNLPVPDTTLLASIGPVTSQAMRDLGMRVDLEASEHTIPGLVRVIREHFEGTRASR